MEGAKFSEAERHGTVGRSPRSNRPRTVRIVENVDLIADLMLSQEGGPLIYQSVCDTLRNSSVARQLHRP